MLKCTNELRTAIGGEVDTASRTAPKRRGMWRRTYERKQFEIEWFENEADRLFLSKFNHLIRDKERQVFSELKPWGYC